MSSLKSLFRKKHKYETQADLKNMTPEQIVNIDPKDIGFYIDKEKGGVKLDELQRRAMYRLIAIKKHAKNETQRQQSIEEFLQNVGIKPNPEVEKLMGDTYIETMYEQLEQKDLENRLRKLKDQPIVPDTEEEAMIRSMRNLKIGGKLRRKTVSKRKRRYNTKKGRKLRKSRRRK